MSRCRWLAIRRAGYRARGRRRGCRSITQARWSSDSSDALVEMLGSETAELHLDVNPPAVILMVGLQDPVRPPPPPSSLDGRRTERKKVLMASLGRPPGGAGAGRARPPDRSRHPPDRRRPDPSRSPSARYGRHASRAMTSSCSTLPRLHVDETLMANEGGRRRSARLIRWSTA
jgi:hypothetical protein